MNRADQRRERDYPEMHTVPGQPAQLVSEEPRDKGSPSEGTRKFVRGEPDDEKFSASFSAFKHIEFSTVGAG